MHQTYLSGTDPTLIRPGLSRITALLQLLGNPQNTLHFVHVAGTNGKGSTSAFIASVLQHSGYRIGLFTSPALMHFSERVQIDGHPISPAALAQMELKVKTAATAMADPPTEFELSVALALLYFSRERCDLAVLEVGLGGAEDATNVIPPPEVAVFTAMGLDHTGILGNTLEEIASAKAGILKPGSSAVSFGNEPACNRIFANRCHTLRIPLTELDTTRLQNVQLGLNGTSFTLLPYGQQQIPLLGNYQLSNALLAVTAIEELKNRGWSIPDSAIANGLASVKWPGRMEILGQNPLFLLDGSHNPQGLQATLSSLAQLTPIPPVILMGVMADKDIPALLRLLLPVAKTFVTVTPSNPRALPADVLAERIRMEGGTAIPCQTIQEAVATALTLAKADGVICALGTLYFSADIRQAYQAYAQNP